MTKRPSPNCVVKVGDGRGFIIEWCHILRIPAATFPVNGKQVHVKAKRVREKRRLVVTAAHCLPKLPPAHALSYTSDRTYAKLLSTLDGKKSASVECLFVDPVADIAVLGSPDNQDYPDEATAYDVLVGDAPVLPVGKAGNGKGWLLGLDGVRWIPTKLELVGMDCASLTTGPTEAGMSGSPILNDRGQAVGVVAIGSETIHAGKRSVDEESGPQPMLTRNLPAWLLL